LPVITTQAGRAPNKACVSGGPPFIPRRKSDSSRLGHLCPSAVRFCQRSHRQGQPSRQESRQTEGKDFPPMGILEILDTGSDFNNLDGFGKSEVISPQTARMSEHMADRGRMANQSAPLLAHTRATSRGAGQGVHWQGRRQRPRADMAAQTGTEETRCTTTLWGTSPPQQGEESRGARGSSRRSLPRIVMDLAARLPVPPVQGGWIRKAQT
jgi:hypothetical protein